MSQGLPRNVIPAHTHQVGDVYFTVAPKAVTFGDAFGRLTGDPSLSYDLGARELTLDADFLMGDGRAITATTGNGLKIGTAATQKLGFYGATPIARPADATQASLTDSTGGTPSTTLAAIAAGATYAQSDMEACRDAIASLARLVNRLRLDLVNLGVIKGAA